MTYICGGIVGIDGGKQNSYPTVDNYLVEPNFYKDYVSCSLNVKILFLINLKENKRK